jgi:NAD(P)-dependent dehydrogenase (short-subunit alcohol dehydrogenase family)
MAGITDNTSRITGATRGIGRAVAQEALDRGGERVHATAPSPGPALGDREDG